MCTIGVVFEGSTVHTFKQCDLIPVTQFDEPSVRPGKQGVDSYIALAREPSASRIWAATNSSGVSFVGADAYTTTSADYYATDDAVSALFDAYEHSIAAFQTVTEAADYLASFYQDMGNGQAFPAPDISLYAGWEDTERTKPIAILLEYMPRPFNHTPVRQIVRKCGHFSSTNNFRLQPNAVSYPANHSTYLRMARAGLMLQLEPSRRGILNLLRDQYYGPTELSVCRETQWIGQEFHTQATAVFSASPAGGMPSLLYQINGNPRTNPLKPFNGAS